ncbi:MAG: NUDIX hydrolase [Proteobacteria bacterium]|nr:NUDIX hydrolase [Pseudomonadota bacterium]
MAGKDGQVQIQFGALPFAFDAAGRPRILLVTSRGSRAWIIPKGWPIRNLTPAGTAAREAYEEAGLLGTVVHPDPIGSYRYAKRRGAARALWFDVSVFLFVVERQMAKWPEKAERKTRWFGPQEAVGSVASAELARVLASALPILTRFSADPAFRRAAA